MKRGIRKPVVDRFMSKTIPVTESGCWLWLGPWNDDGYGVFHSSHHNRQIRAHRAAYFLFVGDFEGANVLHKCDTPACVNPDHLYLGSQSENNRDAHARGRRSSRGQSNGRAKLTLEQVIQIIYSTERPTDLAAAYGVSVPTICAILSGQTWSAEIARVKS